MGLIRTYSFNVNATASSSLTQITSAALNYKHRVIRCKALFSQGLQDYLKVYFFGGIDNNDTDGTTGIPDGVNLLNQPGMPTSGTSLESPYLQSADGPMLVNIDSMTNVRNPNSFLAVRVVNSNTANLRVQAWIEVMEL